MYIKPFLHRDISDVCLPDLVYPLDLKPPRQVRVDLVRFIADAQLFAWVNRPQAHQPHESLRTRFTLTGQPSVRHR